MYLVRPYFLIGLSHKCGGFHKNGWKYNHSNLLFPVNSIRHNVTPGSIYIPLNLGCLYHGTMAWFVTIFTNFSLGDYLFTKIVLRHPKMCVAVLNRFYDFLALCTQCSKNNKLLPNHRAMHP